jgi:hypothetical protein
MRSQKGSQSIQRLCLFCRLSISHQSSRPSPHAFSTSIPRSSLPNFADLQHLEPFTRAPPPSEARKDDSSAPAPAIYKRRTAADTQRDERQPRVRLNTRNNYVSGNPRSETSSRRLNLQAPDSPSQSASTLGERHTSWQPRESAVRRVGSNLVTDTARKPSGRILIFIHEQLC